jgi:hypothetical protein
MVEVASGDTVERSEWVTSIVRDLGRTQLRQAIEVRSDVSEDAFFVARESDPNGFLVSVLVAGPPEGVQVLSTPEYFAVKGHCPRTVRFGIQADGETMTESIPVYVRSKLTVKESGS